MTSSDISSANGVEIDEDRNETNVHVKQLLHEALEEGLDVTHVEGSSVYGTNGLIVEVESETFGISIEKEGVTEEEIGALMEAQYDDM